MRSYILRSGAEFSLFLYLIVVSA